MRGSAEVPWGKYSPLTSNKSNGVANYLFGRLGTNSPGGLAFPVLTQFQIVCGEVPKDPSANLGKDLVTTDPFPVHKVETEFGHLPDHLIVCIHMASQFNICNANILHDRLFAGEVVDQLAIQPGQGFREFR